MTREENKAYRGALVSRRDSKLQLSLLPSSLKQFDDHGHSDFVVIRRLIRPWRPVLPLNGPTFRRFLSSSTTVVKGVKFLGTEDDL